MNRERKNAETRVNNRKGLVRATLTRTSRRLWERSRCELCLRPAANVQEAVRECGNRPARPTTAALG
jgi:hypothetical protein